MTTGYCPQCGRRLKDGELSGRVCPTCLLALAFADREGAASGHGDNATYRVLTVLAGDDKRTIYLGEQRRPVIRLVTIEVVKGGPDTTTTRAVFDTRLDALMRYAGSGAARVLDGVMTATGDCCIIGEFVAGPRLDRYCDSRCLARVERLRLMSAVCAAIEHAHAEGIVHGHLTPDLVIASLSGEHAVPVVTGFGLRGAAALPMDDVRLLVAMLDVIAGVDVVRSLATARLGEPPPFTSAAALRHALENAIGHEAH